jgi:hypothetical protein
VGVFRRYGLYCAYYRNKNMDKLLENTLSSTNKKELAIMVGSWKA